MEKINLKLSLKNTFSKTIKIILIFVIPMFIVYPFSEKLFVFVFGNQWIQGGHIFFIIFPTIILNVVILPFANLAYVLNKKKEFFFISLFNTIFMTTILLVAINKVTFIEFIMIYSATFAVNLVITGFWLFKIYKSYEKITVQK